MKKVATWLSILGGVLRIGAWATTPAVRVLTACDAALRVFRNGGADFTDAEQLTAERATLDACTRKQWLTGAERYRGRSFNNVLVGNVKAAKVLHILLPGQLRRSRVSLTAPAPNGSSCRGDVICDRALSNVAARSRSAVCRREAALGGGE